MKLNRTHKRPLEFSRGPADRDPMAYRDQLLALKAIWYDGAELVVTAGRGTGKDLPDYQKPPLGPASQLPPPSDMQQNDHVMRYWTWRLDRLEGKNNGT